MRNITLGELANFTFQLIGTDYFADNGITTTLQKRYITEEVYYENYNFQNNNNDLVKIKNSFLEELISKYNVSESINHILDIPYFFSINYNYFCPENIPKEIYILVALQGYCIKYLNTEEKSEITLHELFTESYNDIQKNHINSKIAKLDENNCKWNKISKIMEIIVQDYKEDVKIINTKLIRHYLFLHLISALTEVFNIEKERIYETIEEIKLFDRNSFFSIISFSDAWTYMEKIWKENLYQSDSLIQYTRYVMTNVNDFFFNTYIKVEDSFAEQILIKLKKLGDYFNPYWYWMKARSLIFQLDFPLTDSDSEKYKQILDYFEKAFEEGKYIFGNFLEEFLEDAIAAENYFRPKNKLKDKLLENTQDNFSIGVSINNENAKKYWSFGYATGHLLESTKQTYLFAYNCKSNFWNSFLVNKFTSKTALKQKQQDIISEELIIPLYTNLHSKNNNQRDQIFEKLSSNRIKLSKNLNRYYSRISLALINLEDFYNTETKKYDNLLIKNLKKLDINIHDENGATPLIRALYEYKKTRYGFSTEFQKERAKLLSQTDSKLKTITDEITGYMDITEQNPEIQKKHEELSNEFFLRYNSIIEKNQKSVNKEHLKKMQEYLKEIIKILIEKIDTKYLLSEAIELDNHKCVSALQLAIDSYDFELVDLITYKITNLHKLKISEEFLTPLQYAIRKYDILFSNNCSEDGISKQLEKIPIRKSLDFGITQESRLFNRITSINNFTDILICEQTGFINSEEYRNDMQKIIKLLTDKTDYISVDTIYYLSDADCYTDVLELAKYILDTKKLDISRSNYDFNLGIVPNETILARCIRNKNFPLLKIILENKFYASHFKNTINQIVINKGFDSKGNETIVKTTDTDFYFATIMPFLYELRRRQKLQILSDSDKESINMFKNIFILFYKLGARFDIEDNQGKTTAYYINKRLSEDSIPKEVIPLEILELCKSSPL